MPPSINRLVLLCGLSALTAAAEGCQRGPTWNLAPVEGTITKDGRPLRGVQVVFLSDTGADTQGPGASGITDEAGHYRLRNHNGDDGAVVGLHRVCLYDTLDVPLFLDSLPKEAANSEEAQKALKEFQEAASAPPRVPPPYGRFDKTPLRVEVRPGPQTLDFNLP